jgi:hypothetical protein
VQFLAVCYSKHQYLLLSHLTDNLFASLTRRACLPHPVKIALIQTARKLAVQVMSWQEFRETLTQF